MINQNNIINIREEFNPLFEFSLDFLFVYDLIGKIWDANDVAINNLGYSREEILNMSIFDFLMGEDKKTAKQGLKEIGARGKFENYNIFKIKKKDSTLIYLEVSGIPLKDSLDNIYAFLGIGHDITVLKEIEQVLIESEEKNRSLIEAMNQVGIGIDIVNKEYNILFQNDILKKKFGNLTGELCYEKYMGLEDPCDFCPMIEAIKNNKIESIELTAADGRIYELISAPFPNPDGTIDKAAEIVIDRTEHILSEERLINSEKKFRHLFTQSPFSISLFDMKGNLIESNRKFVQTLMEYTNIDYTGQNFIDIASNFKNSNQIIQLFSERFKLIRSGNVLKPLEFYLITMSGKKVWLRWQSSVVKIGNDQFNQVIIQDITEQKEAEERTKESEEKFRTITEQSFMGIAIFQDDLIKYANQAMLNIFGYSMDEVKSWKTLEYLKLFPSEDKELILEQIRKRQEEYDSSQYNYQVRFIKKNGEIGWLELFSNIIEYRGKTTALVSIIDITEQKEVDKKVRESEEKFRNIAEQTFMGITIIQDDLIIYANQAMLDIFGYSMDEVKSWKPLEYLKLFPPEEKDFMSKQERRKKEEYDSSQHNYQVRFIKSNGEKGWLELFSNVIEYKGKKAALVSIIDITDKKMAEELIIEENKRLLELHEMRKDIINRVSHELKTPLTSIYGASEILMEKLRDEMSENVFNFMEISYRGALRLKELVENLLDSSLLDTKKIELKSTNEDIVRIILEVVNEMAHLAKLRNLTIETDLPDSLVLDVDKLRLRQAINNIISNAIKNSPPDRKIFVNLSEEKGIVDIKIKDEGVGITEKEKEKLFEKFGKIERYGMNLDVDIEGSGLGLYISKEIVELHGGQILVKSMGRNKGTTFTIRLYRNS